MKKSLISINVWYISGEQTIAVTGKFRNQQNSVEILECICGILQGVYYKVVQIMDTII